MFFNQGIECYCRMNNCNIVGDVGGPFVLRNTSGEENNVLYISNSTVSGKEKIRIDSDSLKLYVGQNTNITTEDVDHPISVFFTDEVYTRPEQ